jgi:ethanolamine utilization microcompartment shell protein EutS
MNRDYAVIKFKGVVNSNSESSEFSQLRTEAEENGNNKWEPTNVQLSSEELERALAGWGTGELISVHRHTYDQGGDRSGYIQWPSGRYATAQGEVDRASRLDGLNESEIDAALNIVAAENGVSYVISGNQKQDDNASRNPSQKMAGNMDAPDAVQEQLSIFFTEGQAEQAAAINPNGYVKKIKTGVMHTGTKKVTTPTEAAHIAYPLASKAQEALIGIVTDKNGSTVHRTGRDWNSAPTAMKQLVANLAATMLKVVNKDGKTSVF